LTDAGIARNAVRTLTGNEKTVGQFSVFEEFFFFEEFFGAGTTGAPRRRRRKSEKRVFSYRCTRDTLQPAHEYTQRARFKIRTRLKNNARGAARE